MANNSNDQFPAGIRCTLTTKARSERRLDWTELAALAQSRERIEGGVVSTYPSTLAPQIEDLVDQELECCGSWLTLSTESQEGVIRLTATATNPDGVAMIEAMSGSTTS